MAVARVTKESIRLMVEKVDGTVLVVTVPEGCKVTFGAFQIAQPMGREYGGPKASGNAAIRIYEGGEGIQLACITDVKRYQEMDKLKIARYTGEGFEPETPETWAAGNKLGAMAEINAPNVISIKRGITMPQI
jgi:hypothetical protein